MITERVHKIIEHMKEQVKKEDLVLLSAIHDILNVEQFIEADFVDISTYDQNTGSLSLGFRSEKAAVEMSKELRKRKLGTTKVNRSLLEGVYFFKLRR